MKLLMRPYPSIQRSSGLEMALSHFEGALWGRASTSTKSIPAESAINVLRTSKYIIFQPFYQRLRCVQVRKSGPGAGGSSSGEH